MKLSHPERFLRQVDARYLRAGLGHRLGEDSAPTANVENFLIVESAAALRDVVESQRIDVVERLELAARVPPAMRQCAELGEFRRIGVDGWAHWRRSCHRRPSAASSTRSKCFMARSATSRSPATHTSLTWSRPATCSSC